MSKTVTKPGAPAPGKKSLDLQEEQYNRVRETLIDLSTGHKVLLITEKKNQKADLQVVWKGVSQNLCPVCREKCELNPNINMFYVYDVAPDTAALKYVMSHEIGNPIAKEAPSLEKTVLLKFAVVDEKELAKKQASLPAHLYQEYIPDEVEEEVSAKPTFSPLKDDDTDSGQITQGVKPAFNSGFTPHDTKSNFGFDPLHNA